MFKENLKILNVFSFYPPFLLPILCLFDTEASLYYVAYFTLYCFFVIVHNGMRMYAKEDGMSLIRKATDYEDTRFNS